MFTLSIKNAPGGSVRWSGSYGTITSGWLAINEIWDCPYGAYGTTDLTILVMDSGWNYTHQKSGLGPIYDDKDYIYDCASGVLSEILPYEGTITGKEFRHNSSQDDIPASAEIGDKGIVYMWGRNDMPTNQKMGIEWEVYDPDGHQVQTWDQWETWHTGPGLEQGFMGPTFPISKKGNYHIDVRLKMNYDNPEIVNEWSGVLCNAEPAPTEPEFRNFTIESYSKV